MKNLNLKKLSNVKLIYEVSSSLLEEEINILKEIKPDAIISSGGAMVSLNGETIYDNILSSEDVSVIVKEIMSLTYSKAKISAESINGYFCNFIPDDPDRFNAFTYKDFHDFDYPCYKITAELEQDSWGEIIANKCILYTSYLLVYP